MLVVRRVVQRVHLYVVVPVVPHPAAPHWVVPSSGWAPAKAVLTGGTQVGRGRRRVVVVVVGSGVRVVEGVVGVVTAAGYGKGPSPPSSSPSAAAHKRFL